MTTKNTSQRKDHSQDFCTMCDICHIVLNYENSVVCEECERTICKIWCGDDRGASYDQLESLLDDPSTDSTIIPKLKVCRDCVNYGTCGICYERELIENLETCNEMGPKSKPCQLLICRDCEDSGHCEGCRKHLDEDELISCPWCEKNSCTTCCSYNIKPCKYCDENVCIDCYSICDQCNYEFCEDCIESCEDCGVDVCPDCSSKDKNEIIRCKKCKREKRKNSHKFNEEKKSKSCHTCECDCMNK